MTIYGYGRVSTQNQELEVQIQELQKNGATEIYTEKVTGSRTDRPKLQELLKVLKEGDMLMVTKLDRLARNTKEGIELIEMLFDRGVKVHVLNVGLLENTTMGRYFLQTLLAIAEMERNLIIERMQEGKDLAKQNPNYREGRKPKYTQHQLDRAMEHLKTHSFSQVVKIMAKEGAKMSMSTLKRESRKRKEKQLV